MEPVITNIVEENDTLTFILRGTNVSVANALRRVILSNIPSVVFRTSPHDKNKAIFDINTTRMNNELLKQRLSCIPIHIDDITIPITDYMVEVNVKNDSDTIIYVTTDDFKIKNTKTDTYLTKGATTKIFPPDTLTTNYIDFARLRPPIAESVPGEHLKFTCGLDIGTPKEESTFNVASTCSYGYTLDAVEINKIWSAKEKEKRDEGLSVLEIEYDKKDWLLLEAQRYVHSDSFDFIIESVGIYSNVNLVKKACEIMMNKLFAFSQVIQSNSSLTQDAKSTIPHSFDIMLENEDYTLGKVIEYLLYTNYYLGNSSLTYCGFRKPHPHIPLSIIRLGFKEETDKSTVLSILVGVCNDATTIFQKIYDDFSN